MALNHDMAPQRLGQRSDIGRDSTAGLAVAALLLALVLGFSAVDIQSGKALNAETLTGGVQQEQPVLDGRGKWAGYLK